MQVDAEKGPKITSVIIETFQKLVIVISYLPPLSSYVLLLVFGGYRQALA